MGGMYQTLRGCWIYIPYSVCVWRFTAPFTRATKLLVFVVQLGERPVARENAPFQGVLITCC